MSESYIRGWLAAAPQQSKIAAALLSREMSLRDIAKVTGVAYGSVRELLSRMHRRGFVERMARGKYRLTPAVRAALEKAHD